MAAFAPVAMDSPVHPSLACSRADHASKSYAFDVASRRSGVGRCSCAPVDVLRLDSRSARVGFISDPQGASLRKFYDGFKCRNSKSKHARWIGLAGTQGCGDGGRESSSNDSNDEGTGNDEDVEQAIHLDGDIPETSDGFLRQVSSRAYDMRRQYEQSIDSSSYDVLEVNPWREDSKSVYVLAQDENILLTMRTRRSRSEVERELGLLFPKRGSRRGNNGIPRVSSVDQALHTVSSSSDTRFRMVVEDVREGVLVFALCQNTKALAVLFRRGRIPPLPDRLQQNLKARKQSLED
eukprot:c24610_g1_i1 orf=548-1429(-)